ncbi:hypothetical protein K9M47_03700 [Candidatus Gracilibacteria bacterium]|nr:hypothetical protein [Candidatus Gracilibacteria bacterium]
MININRRRFGIIFRSIFNAYLLRSHGFALYNAENSAPQVINKPKCVEIGDQRHLYWFTLVGMSDTRTTSSTLYPRFAEMFDRNPTLFKIGYIPTEKRVTELFRKYRIALPVKQIKFFIERKRHLDLIFNGNPLEIYSDVKTIDELMLKLNHLKKKNGIKNIFPGAKRKVFTLLAMFLSEFAEFDFEEVVPVDVWVQSIANSTHALSGEGVIDINKLEQMIRPVLVKVFKNFKHHHGAASATWILGNKFCSNCHRTDVSNNCPVFKLCDGPSLRMRHPESDKHYGRIERPFNPRGKFRKITIVSVS